MDQFSRRSMLKGALPAFGVSALSLPDFPRPFRPTARLTSGPNSKSPMCAPRRSLVHGPQTHVRIYTDQGIYGQGECNRCCGRRCVADSRLAAHADWARSTQRGSDLGADSHLGNLRRSARPANTSPRCRASRLRCGILQARRWDCPSTSFWAESFGTRFGSIATRIWMFLSARKRTASFRGSRIKASRP